VLKFNHNGHRGGIEDAEGLKIYDTAIWLDRQTNNQ